MPCSCATLLVPVDREPMLTSDQINELHRLYISERWPIRKIERHLKLGWKTIKEYLETPAQGAATRERRSKLDPFKAMIAECLEKDPSVTAALFFERIKDQRYSGGHAILQEYVRKVRPQPESKRAFVRMEPFDGERFEVDWVHFDVLNYRSSEPRCQPRPTAGAMASVRLCRANWTEKIPIDFVAISSR